MKRVNARSMGIINNKDYRQLSHRKIQKQKAVKNFQCQALCITHKAVYVVFMSVIFFYFFLNNGKQCFYRVIPFDKLLHVIWRIRNIRVEALRKVNEEKQCGKKICICSTLAKCPVKSFDKYWSKTEWMNPWMERKVKWLDSLTNRTWLYLVTKLSSIFPYPFKLYKFIWARNF
jgi:hypothetical protein